MVGSRYVQWGMHDHARSLITSARTAALPSGNGLNAMTAKKCMASFLQGYVASRVAILEIVGQLEKACLS